MTHVRDLADGELADTGQGTGYRALLRTPGALSFSAAAFVGRMPMAMVSLGTILLISAMTGRYGLAGAVAAAGAVGYAVCAPVSGKLADVYGQRRVLIPQAIVFALATASFIALAQARAPFWTLLISGAAVGSTEPSLGPMVRTRWSVLVGADPRRLHTAFAVESIADEFIFVIGPALVTFLATQIFPAAGIGTAAVLGLIGTLAFAALRRTEPQPRETRAASRFNRPDQSRAARLPATGLVTLGPVMLLLGSMFATIDLSTVAFAAARGHKPLAGLILGTFALGSAVGGLWYGSRHWHSPPGRRFGITISFTVAGVLSFWAMPGLLALDGAVFLSGLAIAPTLIAGYGILESQAAADRRTEAMSWLGSMIGLGVALGSAVAGRIVDALGPRWGFGYAAACGVLAVVISLVGRRKLDTDPAQLPGDH